MIKSLEASWHSDRPHLLIIALGVAAVVTWIIVHARSMWQVEKRVQYLEHEVASLHANGAPGPQPATPNVAQRYEQMKVGG